MTTRGGTCVHRRGVQKKSAVLENGTVKGLESLANWNKGPGKAT